MCKFFGVSRSGYYAFVHRLGRPEKDAALAEAIAQQRERSFRTYGYRRMWLWLKSQNILRNPKTVLRIMKKYDLLSEIRRRRKWQQLGQQVYKYRNLLNRDFHADKPNRKWVTELNDDEMLVLMGHGTDHHANSAYPTLEYTFHALGYNQVLIGTVESFPELKNVMAKLEIAEKKKVALMPFMLVAGDHAKNDMAGDEDSWKSQLEDEGYEVRVIMKGLGEFEGIRRIFLEHIEEAME